MRHLPLSAVLPLALVGCTTLARPALPRPALPLEATFVHPIDVPELTATEDLAPGRMRGHLRGAGEQVEFQLWRASEAAGPRALVLLVPILHGGASLLDAVAERMLDRGFDVAFCKRVGKALDPPQRGADLQELFRRTVLHQRLLLAWLRDTRTAGEAGTFVLGISMGGMVTAALAAYEPALDGVAICLAGADVAHLVTATSEPRVLRWVHWREREDGVGGSALHWELQTQFALEPMRLAASVRTDRVLFVSAGFDTVVPRRHQDLLWEALGRPDRLEVPLGHYTAALAIDPILTAVARHFRSRLPVMPAAAAH